MAEWGQHFRASNGRLVSNRTKDDHAAAQAEARQRELARRRRVNRSVEAEACEPGASVLANTFQIIDSFELAADEHSHEQPVRLIVVERRDDARLSGDAFIEAFGLTPRGRFSTPVLRV